MSEGFRFPLFLGLLLAVSPIATLAAEAEGISETQVAELAARAMQQFDVPGMAIGIVRGDQMVYAKGFGIREIDQPGQINTATMFKIASNSKAFTTAALAILVDEGKISWNGSVVDYLPEFKMFDPWVTAQFTVIDLLTHRSGLGQGSGDLMLWPEPNLYTHADIIHALRYFKPASQFRTEYAYDNSLYIVAGQIIPSVTDQTWGEFVQQRIMRPLGMDRCYSTRIPASEMNNLAVPHAVIDGSQSVIERGRIPAQPPVSAAAGGIICSLDGLLPWVKTQLGRGTTGQGFELFSKAQNQQMWQPHTNRSVSDRDYRLNRTHFKAYGLGWHLEDVHGYKQVSHTGTLAGMMSYIVLIPELDLGVVVLINGASSDARMAVMSTIVRSFMPVEPIDWIQALTDERAARKQKQAATVAGHGSFDAADSAFNVADLSIYAGRYRDPWFGDISITLIDGGLVFSADKSPKLSGPMFASAEHQFIVRWTDRSVDADAYVRFEFEADGAVGMTMDAVSEWADFSFDFQDLNFTKLSDF